MLTLPVSSFASTKCYRKSSLKTPDKAASVKFLCGKGKKRFSALCDLTIDPVEFGKGWVDVEKAKWVEHAENAGIEGKFGFIVCKKIAD